MTASARLVRRVVTHVRLDVVELADGEVLAAEARRTRQLGVRGGRPQRDRGDVAAVRSPDLPVVAQLPPVQTGFQFRDRRVSSDIPHMS